MDFMDISRQRHTVRSFAPTPVEPELLEKVLEAGRWAPTAVNAQPQRILVLDTPENLDKVRQFCTFGWQKTYADLAKESDTADHSASVFYYGAPVVLMVCFDRTACWTHPQSGKSSGATDATIVAVHMMLEATSLDLGTAWISYFDEEKARELLGIPDDWQPVCMLYVGYEAEGARPNANLSPKRKPLAETCFFNGVN
ncbi:MAG: nitroreductase family protein [Eggerthellaceae bacterium]|nr:nitroreductase family protein [Eggerthellaceae bacterium]